LLPRWYNISREIFRLRKQKNSWNLRT
jgi:hypothetical protein